MSNPHGVDELRARSAWNQSLRWGGAQYAEFTLQSGPQPTAPLPTVIFQSNLLAQAKAERPRTWSGLMQYSFDLTPDGWGAVGTGVVWIIEFRVYVGVGQAQIQQSDFWQGNPTTGFVRQGAASATPPYAPNITSQWPAVPAAELNAQIVISTSSTSADELDLSGTASAAFAPYFAHEALL